MANKEIKERIEEKEMVIPKIYTLDKIQQANRDFKKIFNATLPIDNMISLFIAKCVVIDIVKFGDMIARWYTDDYNRGYSIRDIVAMYYGKNGSAIINALIPDAEELKKLGL